MTQIKFHYQGWLWVAFDAAAPSNPSLGLILRNSVNELCVFVSSVIQLPTSVSCFVHFSEMHKTAFLLKATQCGWILTPGHQRYQHGVNDITIQCRALEFFVVMEPWKLSSFYCCSFIRTWKWILVTALHILVCWPWHMNLKYSIRMLPCYKSIGRHIFTQTYFLFFVSCGVVNLELENPGRVALVRTWTWGHTIYRLNSYRRQCCLWCEVS
jgi:hypothetical protein